MSHVYPSSVRAWVTLSVLVVGVLLAYVDRQILSLLVDPIRVDLGLNDTQIGVLQGPAFALFYAFAALPLGLMIDRYNRRNILIVGVLVWSLATAACGLAVDFWSLFAARVGVAVGEACLIPGVLSLLGDTFSPRRKPTAFAVYMVLVLVGSSLAIAASGAVIDAITAGGVHLGTISAPWRVAFLCVAIPGPAVALAFAALREPQRTGVVGGVSTEALDRDRLIILAWLVPGLACASVAFQLTLAWFPTVLVRDYGLSGGQAGRLLGLSIALASLGVGLVAALAPRLLKNRLRPMLLWASAGLLVGAPLLLLTHSIRPDTAVLGATLAAAPALLAYCLAPTLIQAIAPNRYWGRTTAVFKLIESIMIAIAAVAVGVGSDRLGQGGLATALTAALALSLCLGALALLRARGQLARLPALEDRSA